MPLFSLDPGALPANYGEALLPLDDVKAHLRVDGAEEDGLIGYYRDAAIQLVEKMAGMALGPRDGVVVQDVRIRADGSLCLDLWPVRALTSVQGYDSSGDPLVVPVGDLAVRKDHLVLKPGASWPDGLTGMVDILFDAGAEDAAAARSTYPGLIQACLLMIAYLYSNRTTAGPDGDVPPGVLSIVRGFRMPRL